MSGQQQLSFGFSSGAGEQPAPLLGPLFAAVAEPAAVTDTGDYVSRYRAMIEQTHAAMFAGDRDQAMAVRKQAYELAAEMNGGTHCGIMGDDDSPCKVLERATAAPAGTVPLWGQTGEYIITVDGMRVKIEQDGMFGIGCSSLFWTPFAVHAVDYDRPFISETGYRSFCGFIAEPQSGYTPDTFACELLRAHIKKEMKGKLTLIDVQYRDRLRERAA